MKKHLCQLLALVGIPLCAVSGNTPPLPPGDRVELTPAFINSLAETLRTNNPASRAAGARAEAAAANVAAVRTWEDPEVTVGGMFADSTMRAEDGDLLYGVEQKLPLFGRPRAMRQMAAREGDVMRADRDAVFQRLRSALAQALFRAAYAQRAADIGAEDLAWLTAMLRTTEDRYRVADVPQFQLLRLQNEHARRADAVISDKRRVAGALAEVNRILGQPIDSAWPQLQLPAIAGEVSYNDQILEMALNNEPEIAVLREKVRLAEATVETVRRARYPEVTLGAEGRQYTGNGDFRQAMVTLSVSLPWVNRGKYREDVHRESARRTAAEFDLADRELAVREEVRRLTVSIDAARREALLYRDRIIPRAEQALESAQAAWLANRAMFLDVLESRRMLVEGRLGYARAVSEQYQLLSELVLCCGLGDLEALLIIGAAAPEPAATNP